MARVHGTEMNELELIVKEVAGVTERLTRLPDHAYAERVRLHTEQERLRAEAAMVRERAERTAGV